jgi:hypothetical protein
VLNEYIRSVVVAKAPRSAGRSRQLFAPIIAAKEVEAAKAVDTKGRACWSNCSSLSAFGD